MMAPTPINPVNGHAQPMRRKISSNTLEQFAPLKDERRLSLQSAIQKTKEGLDNPFACDEQSPEELIYNLFKIPNKSDASIGKLIMVLKNYGLQENDPRLAPMMRKIREIENEKEERMNEARDPKHWKMSHNDFTRVISESLSLIVQTLQNDLIVPAWAHFCSIIKEIYTECIPITDGKVANYIPQLARMSPNYWGVSICTVDGQRISFGDSNVPFCVQSVSKALNYSIAASEMGAEYVHQYVGQEPSGRLFNEICLDPNNKPHNPMVNSGAIIVTSLIRAQLNMADRFEYMINEYKKMAGGEYVGFNNAVFLSEAATADRNFALAYFMKENGCFPEESKHTALKETLDFYFQLCSLEVNCEGAAVIAATLANGGVCPLTGERCIGSRPCRDVLSLMNSCGMYDYSGQFAFHVGLPAKSGVSGVMIVQADSFRNFCCHHGHHYPQDHQHKNNIVDSKNTEQYNNPQQQQNNIHNIENYEPAQVQTGGSVNDSESGEIGIFEYYHDVRDEQKVMGEDVDSLDELHQPRDNSLQYSEMSDAESHGALSTAEPVWSEALPHEQHQMKHERGQLQQQQTVEQVSSAGSDEDEEEDILTDSNDVRKMACMLSPSAYCQNNLAQQKMQKLPMPSNKHHRICQQINHQFSI
uniref:glutaminase n=1 Tax=Globodera pallida TaxID=36090 RepID=A0A183CA45_GLOPA